MQPHDPSQKASDRFNGAIDQTLDTKHRVTIPAVWRLKNDQGERAEEEEFFLMPGRRDPCIEVMPPVEFSSVAGEIDQLTTMTPRDRRQAKRAFYSLATHIVADKQGRFVLPDKLCKQFDLEGQIVFVGVGQTFEIWNAATRKASADADDNVLSRAFELIGR